MLRAALVAALLLAARPAAADVVVLTDGQEISGSVTESADQVTVVLDFGSVSFSRSEVLEIRRGATPLHELEQRHARLSPSDVAGRLNLARWAGEQGLGGRARAIYREVLVLRPDDATAHARLGHVKHEGRWMTEEEHMLATGHARYGGRWVTQAEAAELEEAARARRTHQDERALRRLELEVQARRAELEREREVLDEQHQRDAESNYLWTYGWWSRPGSFHQSRRTAGFNLNLRARLGRTKARVSVGRPPPPRKPALPPPATRPITPKARVSRD